MAGEQRAIPTMVKLGEWLREVVSWAQIKTVVAAKHSTIIIVVIIIHFGIMVSAPCSFADRMPPQVMVYDFGSFSCGLWLEVRARRNDPHDVRFAQAREWISGFLTAYNRYVHEKGDVADWTGREGLYAWLDNYCRENPTVLLFFAATKLIEHLERQ